MPAIAKGTTYQRAGKWFARVTIGPGKRPEFYLPTATTEEAARERTAVLAGLAALLRPKASAEQVKALLERAATANGRGVQAVRAAAEAIASGKAKLPDDGDVTVARLAEQLRSGDFTRRFPQYTTVAADHETLALHVLPVIGSKLVAEVTLADCDEVMATLPCSKVRSDGSRGLASTLAHHTRRNVAIAMDRFFALSVDPLRIRAYSPIPAGFIPYKILGIGAARFTVFGHDVTLDELALVSGTSAQTILARMNSGMPADAAAFQRVGSEGQGA